MPLTLARRTSWLLKSWFDSQYTNTLLFGLKDDPISAWTSKFRSRRRSLHIFIRSPVLWADVSATLLARLTEDVLKRLHQMSSESLAANGESIRHKVLFIASSLLNKYPAQDSAGHEHVADFLQGGSSHFDRVCSTKKRHVNSPLVRPTSENIVYNKILTNQTKSNLDDDDLDGEDVQRGSHP